MLIVKGTNVFPSQIEDVVMSFPEVTDNFQIILWKKDLIDELMVKAEVKNEFWNRREEIKRKIEKRLRDVTFLRIDVRCVQEASLPKTEGKAKRVIDSRKEA